MEKHIRAFTLIEVVVALALFSISILMLTQSFLNGLLCKNTLSQENTNELKYDMVRSVLSTLPRDKVKDSHSLYLPDNTTQVSWQGEVTFGEVLNLYKVDVEFQEEKERGAFWIRRPDWMNAEEKQSLVKENTSENDS